MSLQLFPAAVPEEQSLLLLAEMCFLLAVGERRALKQAPHTVLKEEFAGQGWGN